MTRIARTLWDLLSPPGDRRRPAPSAPVATRPAAPRRRPTMQQRYDALVIEMKQTYRFRVRRWRRSTTGCAWEVRYARGETARLIEAPYPRGPVSCAVFLHEVGHHAIGFGAVRPRCLEEYRAWQWALGAMQERGLNVTDAVRRRVDEALRYAVAKARRRGLRRLPTELRRFAG